VWESGKRGGVFQALAVFSVLASDCNQTGMGRPVAPASDKPFPTSKGHWTANESAPNPRRQALALKRYCARQETTSHPQDHLHGLESARRSSARRGTGFLYNSLPLSPCYFGCGSRRSHLQSLNSAGSHPWPGAGLAGPLFGELQLKQAPTCRRASARAPTGWSAGGDRRCQWG
jgi:hypothetical protein